MQLFFELFKFESFFLQDFLVSFRLDWLTKHFQVSDSDASSLSVDDNVELVFAAWKSARFDSRYVHRLIEQVYLLVLIVNRFAKTPILMREVEIKDRVVYFLVFKPFLEARALLVVRLEFG